MRRSANFRPLAESRGFIAPRLGLSDFCAYVKGAAYFPLCERRPGGSSSLRVDDSVYFLVHYFL